MRIIISSSRSSSIMMIMTINCITNVTIPRTITITITIAITTNIISLLSFVFVVCEVRL